MKRGGQEKPGQPGEQAVGGEGGQGCGGCGDGKSGRARPRSVSPLRVGCRRTRLGHEPQPDQGDRPEPDEHEVGQRQLQLPPLGEAGRRSMGRLRVAPTFTDVPMVRARTIDAFGSARRRNSMR